MGLNFKNIDSFAHISYFSFPNGINNSTRCNFNFGAAIKSKQFPYVYELFLNFIVKRP